MKVTVSGKQVVVGDAFSEYAEARLEEAVDKYFDSGIGSSLAVSWTGSVLRINITTRPGRGIIVLSHGVAETARLAFEIASEKIAKRLRRHKRRLRDYQRRDKSEAKQNRVNIQRYVIVLPKILALPITRTTAALRRARTPPS